MTNYHELSGTADQIYQYLYSAIYFSIIGAGGIYLGSNPANQVFELDHAVRLTTPKLIITSKDVLPVVLQVCATNGIPTSRVYVLDVAAFPFYFGSPSPTYRLPEDSLVDCDVGASHYVTDLLSYGEADWVSFSDEQTAKATPAAYFSTSGTSGYPKAAVISHYALVSHHLSIHQDVPYEVRRLMSLPAFHIFGALWAHLSAIRYGQPCYILPRFHGEKYVNAINQYKITDTFMAPPMVHILNSWEKPLDGLIDTIRYVGVGGAPIDAPPMQKLRSRLHADATVSNVWGMTEIGAAVLFPRGEHDSSGSIGRLLPGYEMKLFNTNGNEVTEDGQAGELFIRSPGVMSGYKGVEVLKEELEWFRTGDIMCKKEGKLFIVGRAKELIKVKGYEIQSDPNSTLM